MLTKHVTIKVGSSSLNIMGEMYNLLCLTVGQCLDGTAEAGVPLGGGVGGWAAARGFPAGPGSGLGAASDEPRVLGRPLNPSPRRLSEEAAGRDMSPRWECTPSDWELRKRCSCFRFPHFLRKRASG